MEFLGFEFKRLKKSKKETSFVQQEKDDGAISTSAGSFGGQALINLDPKATNDVQRISEYRKASLQPEMEEAIDDIVNEVVVDDDTDRIVNIVLEDLDVSDSIKKMISEEYEYIYDLYDFQRQGYEIFKNWYVDSMIYYHVIIDEARPKEGIKELRYIDPRKMKKIRVNKSKKNEGERGIRADDIEEYFVFSNSFVKNTEKRNSPNMINSSVQGVKIKKDSIVHVTSGLTKNGSVISHLDAALKPLNSLRLLEDSLIIYRVSRAPERRVFYIDVGSLPKDKAEQYINTLSNKYKNKLVFDPSTGTVKDGARVMSMMEDHWLPRREGGRGTEISTLPGGQNLGEIEDVLYFQKKLYRALKVPITRRESDQNFQLGRANDVSRDEVKFSKFVRRLRLRFSNIFNEALGRQLLLKSIITPEDWELIKSKIRYEYSEDNHYAELKQMEIVRERFASLRDVDEYIGRFVSKNWTLRNVLMLSEDEINEMKKEIDTERKAGEYDDFTDENGMNMFSDQPPAQSRPEPEPEPKPSVGNTEN